MAFRFKRKESVAEGWRRLCAGEIEAAATTLEKSGAGGVHAARRALRQARGLVRLYRSALDRSAAALLQRRLRQAAHQLAPIRDAEVRLKTFDRLARRPTASALVPFRAALVERAALAARPEAAEIPELIARLRELATGLPQVAEDAGWAVLRRGIKRSYRRARNAHAEARAEMTLEALHQWRRRCKDYAAHLELLHKAGDRTLHRRVRRLQRLTAALGEARDLAALDQALASTSGRAREKLARRLERCRQKRQRRAFDLAHELFFDRPSEVIEALGRAWKKWHRG